MEDEGVKVFKSKKAVSPVLATLLMVAVAVSMSVIIFMWSQGFLSTTSEAASSQQQAQNVAAQSSIAIESVQFTDAEYWDEDASPETSGTLYSDRAIKIVVRNVGSSKVTIGQVYVGESAYQMTGYSAYKVVQADTAPTGYEQIGQESDGDKWWADDNAFTTTDSITWANGIGYQGTLNSIYAQWADMDAEDDDLTQVSDTAVVYVFGSDGSADTDGEIDPQGFAVVHLYLSSAWTAGETYFIKVTTTVGTFAETAVTA
jgi:flagellin-like protein